VASLRNLGCKMGREIQINLLFNMLDSMKVKTIHKNNSNN
jgi:hypothetical protein